MVQPLPAGSRATWQADHQINDLLTEGYDAYGNGKCYPYVLVSPAAVQEDKTYQVAICGVSDKLAAEAEVVDSGVVGMDAAKAFFGSFETLSRANAAWDETEPQNVEG